MDPAVKDPDLKVQDPSLLSTIDKSEAEDTTTTTTAPEVTETHAGQTTTRGASMPKASSTATTSEALAVANAQAQVQAGQESSVPSLFSLAEKVIVVTGGARGIGLSMAQSLIDCGATGKPFLPLVFPLLLTTLANTIQSMSSTASPIPAPSSTALLAPFPQEH